MLYILSKNYCFQKKGTCNDFPSCYTSWQPVATLNLAQKIKMMWIFYSKITSQLLKKDYFYTLYANSNATVGGALHIPVGIHRCAELHLLDMECVRAKPLPHLVERGQTCGCRSPD